MALSSRKQLRERYRRQGRCTGCSRLLDDVRWTQCSKCRERSKNRNRTFKANGLCRHCGKRPPVGKLATCDECRTLRDATFKRRYEKAATDKLCRQCLGPVPENRASCERCLEAKRRCNRKVKDEVFEAYGGYVCACCGITEPMFLQIDHVQQDGYKLRKQQGMGSRLYQWLKRNGYPEGYQVLCANCNWARSRRDNPDHICPHEVARQSLVEVTPAYQAA